MNGDKGALISDFNIAECLRHRRTPIPPISVLSLKKEMKKETEQVKTETPAPEVSSAPAQGIELPPVIPEKIPETPAEIKIDTMPLTEHDTSFIPNRPKGTLSEKEYFSHKAKVCKGKPEADDIINSYQSLWPRNEETDKEVGSYIKDYYICRAVTAESEEAGCKQWVNALNKYQDNSHMRNTEAGRNIYEDCVDITSMVKYYAWLNSARASTNICLRLFNDRYNLIFLKKNNITKEEYCGIAQKGLQELCKPGNKDKFCKDRTPESLKEEPVAMLGENPEKDYIFTALKNNNPGLCAPTPKQKHKTSSVTCKAIINRDASPCETIKKELVKAYCGK